MLKTKKTAANLLARSSLKIIYYDFKKSEKNFNIKYLRNLWINPFAQRTHPISIQNLPLNFSPCSDL